MALYGDGFARFSHCIGAFLPVPLAELAKFHPVFVDALRNTKGKQRATVIQLNEHDLSFIKTDQDVYDYCKHCDQRGERKNDADHEFLVVRLIRLDENRVMQEATQARGLLRNQLHQIFDNIRLQACEPSAHS